MKRLTFWVTIFVLGAITGAALTGVSVGKQVDSLYIKNQFLREKLLATEKQLNQLQETNQTKYSRVISNISTHINFSDKCDYTEFERSTIELTVEKKVREWLKIISGQEVENINYLLIPRIVDSREIMVEDKKICLKVDLVVISERVIVYLEIIPLKNKV